MDVLAPIGLPGVFKPTWVLGRGKGWNFCTLKIPIPLTRVQGVFKGFPRVYIYNGRFLSKTPTISKFRINFVIFL